MWKCTAPIMGMAIALGIAGAAVPGAANGPAACAPRDYIVRQLTEKHEERQVAVGLAAGGQVMELFAAQTGGWTLLASLPDGVTCIVATGTDLSLDAPGIGAPAGDPA